MTENDREKSSLAIQPADQNFLAGSPAAGLILTLVTTSAIYQPLSGY